MQDATEQTSEINVSRMKRKTKSSPKVKAKSARVAKQKEPVISQSSPVVRSPSASYLKLDKDNRQWIAKQSYTTGHTTTAVINAALTALRKGSKFELDEYQPKYLAKALEAKAKRLEALKRQAGL